MEENLKRKTTKALVWSTADKLGQQLFYLVAGIILARQLSPEDYGKVGFSRYLSPCRGYWSTAVSLRLWFGKGGYSGRLQHGVLCECGDQLRAVWIVVCSSTLYSGVFKVPDLIYICRILFLVIPLNALPLYNRLCCWSISSSLWALVSICGRWVSLRSSPLWWLTAVWESGRWWLRRSASRFSGLFFLGV